MSNFLLALVVMRHLLLSVLVFGPLLLATNGGRSADAFVGIASSPVHLMTQHQHRETRRSVLLYSQRPPSPQPQQQKQQQAAVKEDDDKLLLDDETPAGIVGAQFFGGNKEKEEFYDEDEERNVLSAMSTTIPTPTSGMVPSSDVATSATTATAAAATASFFRFDNRQAFSSDQVAHVASSLQSQINSVLYDDDSDFDRRTSINMAVEYTKKASQLDWVTSLPSKATTTSSSSTTTTTPLEELRTAKSFYKHVDLAIVSGREIQSEEQPSSTTTTTLMELQWELSVTWPTFWEPRVLLLGSSVLTLTDSSSSSCSGASRPTTTRTIVRQVDTINGGLNRPGTGILPSLIQQLTPRFWDLYHIGMTPSAELSPRLILGKGGGNGVNSYHVSTIPARWMIQPTIVETGTRLDGNAQILPNHVFSSFISTMGPTRQRYVPTVGTTVQIRSNVNNSNLNNNNNKDDAAMARPRSIAGSNTLLQWQIPMSVEFQTNPTWLLAPPNEEAIPDSDPHCEYVFQSQKLVATVAYGGEAQDAEIGQIRKQLYESVLKDGIHTPKLDDNGRPIFFFSYGTTKACYTRQGGLGMCVYEWRPSCAKANQVGLELQNPGETTSS